jgi:polysaccharide pyruvyl transferase WcaK-like protein
LIKRLPAGAGSPMPRLDLSDFHLIWFAGGGNLTKHFPDIVAWRTAIAAAAKANRVPFILSGQGVGPISDDTAGKLRFLVRHAHRFAARDSLSADLVAELGRRQDDVDCIGDDAIGLTHAADSIVDYYLEASGVRANTPLLGFHAREAPDYGCFDRERLVELARFVDRVAAEHGFAVAGLPINSQAWAPEAELLKDLARCESRRARWYVVECGDNVSALAGVIGRCRAVISLSYHAALFALERGIPTRMAVRTEYYRRKAEGLRQLFGMKEEIILADRYSEADWIVSNSTPLRSSTNISAAIDAWLAAILPRSTAVRGDRAA